MTIIKNKKKTDGTSFVTPLGKTFLKVKINYSQEDLSILRAFPAREKLKSVVDKSRHFKEQFPETFNGILLGNPKISIREDGSLFVEAQRLHYQTYFAAHELRQEKPGEVGENYCALSVCGIVYDNQRKSFFMSVRPKNSQEDPLKIDAPGGVLNPDFENADPFRTAQNRFFKKLGLDNLKINCLGVERIFDEKYSLYDVAMYSEVQDSLPSVEQETFVEIPLSEAEQYLNGDRLTAPARATLLLALSQDKFKGDGWGKERIESIMK